MCSPPSLPGDSPELRRGRPESLIRVPSPESRVPISSPESRIPNPDWYTVVWWDPHCLHLGATSSFGLRRDDLIVKDGDMFAIEERMVAYERWRAERDAVVERREPARASGSRPQPRGPRRRRGTASITSSPKRPASRSSRCAARRTGRAVRGSAAWSTRCSRPCPSIRSGPVVQRTAETQGRLLMASDAEVRAAAVVVTSVLRHELIARALAVPGSGASRRLPGCRKTAR